MVNKKEISDFADFCRTKYRIKLKPEIVEDFLQTINSKIDQIFDTKDQAPKSRVLNCSSNNIECTHLNFDSAKCDKCPY